MAINKRKILQSAQKHMQKGALDKALKDYGTLLEADPGDANIRLKVGDIHLKQGKTNDAVESYLKVAQRFMKDGFDSKAIALYKQVTKVDPKRYDVYVPLSELYQRLGLKSDALKALQTAADAQYREGNKDQALDLLRKMATFDPSNTTNRLKVAELLRQEGRQTEAVAEYDEVVEELERQGDVEERINVLHKILEIDPSRTVTFVALGSALVEQQKWSAAEATAEAMTDALPGEPEGYELLARIFQESGRENELPGVYRRLAEVYKDRGDEDHAREIMQRFVSTEALGTEGNGDPILEQDDQLALDAAIGDGTLALEADESTDPDFFSGEGLELGEEIGDAEEEGPAGETGQSETTATSLPPLPALGNESVSDEQVPEPEGDGEQLFAEASVYLRYGKHERAIETLRAVLSQNPGHRPALEKLGEALVALGDTENAVTALSRAAKAAREEGDDASFESLRAKLEALDPAAAQSLAPAPPPLEGEILEEEEFSEDLETIDIEVDSDVEVEQAQEVLESDDSIEFEIDDDFGFDDAPNAEEVATEPSAQVEELAPEPEAAEFDLDDGELPFESAEGEDVEEEIEFADAEDADAVAPEASLEDTVVRGLPAPPPSGNSATTPQRMIEDLEEADFYFQQGLFDEAEEVYGRILEAAPNHPQAMLRMGEIEAARGGSEEVLPEPEEDPVLEADAVEVGAETPPSEPLREVPVSDFDAEPPATEFEAEVPAAELDAEPPATEFEAEVPAAELDAEPPATEFEAEVPAAELDAEPPATEFEAEVAATDFEAEVQEPIPTAPETLGEQDGGEDDFGMDLPEPSSLPDLEGVAELDLEINTSEERAAGAEPTPQVLAAAQAEETLPLVGEAATPLESDADEEGDTGDFDLAAELSGALDGEDTGPLSGGRGGTTEEEGFEQVFAAFKQGVQQELGDEDLETHYDLGIAYKEMGLLEDAIGEFQIALGAPPRKLAALHAMGLCAFELERVSDAISHLEQALALPVVSGEEQTALYFDLGRAYHEKGDLARARSAYETVAAADPNFGAVGELIAELERRESSEEPESVAAGEEEEALESFDDLIEESVQEPARESYESFDDLMSEDADEEDEASAAFEPPLVEPEAPEIETEPAPDLEPEVAEPQSEAASDAEPGSWELEAEPAPDLEPEVAELEAEPAPDLEPEVAELEAEPAPDLEPEVAELEAEPAPDLEPEVAELEAEPAPDLEPEVAELEAEPAPDLEPEAAEFEAEPTPDLEPEIAELEAEPAPDLEPEVAEPQSEAASDAEPGSWEFETEPAPEEETGAAEADPGPEPALETPASEKPARRKKISFV